MDFTNIQNVIETILPPTVSALVGWFLAKRKYNAEVDSTVIKNMKDTLDYYKELSDDNKKRLEESLSENRRLNEDIKTLNKEIIFLNRKIGELSAKIDFMANYTCNDATCQNRKIGIKKTIKADSSKDK